MSVQNKRQKEHHECWRCGHCNAAQNRRRCLKKVIRFEGGPAIGSQVELLVVNINPVSLEAKVDNGAAISVRDLRSSA
jgi:hypothetical protein